jgi:hypothetical protein
VNHSILSAFIADQRKAKAIVSAKLNIPQDIRAIDWALRHGEIRDAYNACPFADVFRPHGYGLELKIGDLYIDYDYSETGRADGFDAWRLFVYITGGEFDNNGPDANLSCRVDQWIRQLVESEQIIRVDNLYYLNPGPPGGA